MMFNYSDLAKNIQLDKLLAELLSIKDSLDGMSLFLLYHPLIDNNDYSWGADNSTVPITYANYSVKNAPTLIELDLVKQEHKDLLKKSLQEALSEIHPDKLSQFKSRKIYGWLLSPLTIKDLAYQIGYVAIQSRDIEHKDLLRYYDPAIMPLLMSILSFEQKDKVLRPVAGWLYLNGDGQMVYIKNKNKIRKHLTSELALSQMQWSMINDIVVCNQVLTRYRKSHIDCLRISEEQYVERIWGLLGKAKEIAYDQIDIITCCYYLLVVHPNMMEHSKIINLIQNFSNHRLSDKLVHLSDSDWKTIKEDLEGVTNDKM